ncbi:hypothetical protein [Caldilinea sp.]|mgnify:CR=1 FL=1|uniref:hypothetical protein n=1 Tax=Caldilinea sp. TaxID=2293560 RepID=UPI002CE5081D|nr:hypothetical protein [Anaerolineales bacterium]HQY95174.1 hypothetical protein [Caldilinea sp.]
MTVASVLYPLIARNIFPDEETAVRELALDYMLRQIEETKKSVALFEHKYSMSFTQFEQYLHARARLLESSALAENRRRRLSQTIMLEEDDWIDWKAAHEMLESWLGLQQEVDR